MWSINKMLTFCNFAVILLRHISTKPSLLSPSNCSKLVPCPYFCWLCDLHFNLFPIMLHSNHWIPFPLAQHWDLFFSKFPKLSKINKSWGSLLLSNRGFPRWLAKESAYQCRRNRFDPRVGKIPWRMKWQPMPVFMPGEFHEQRSLEGYSPWDCKRVRSNWAITL